MPKQNLSKLKPRSAVIAFNINKVYEMAEILRTHKGGAAVILGSLSPRTRNAQVEVYEEKKVDYLVATDAIGMGLNLNINHISFSSFQKFDGRYNRNLSPSEIGQIAGRAGRYKNDGTFGYTKEAEPIDQLIIQSVENHKFDEIQKIYWRNFNIDFTSVKSILNSLKQFPVKSFFIHKKNAEDEINFKKLIEDDEIRSLIDTKTNLLLLWDVCKIPDFQKIFNDNYINFLKEIFLILIKNNHKIPEDWFSKNILRLENFQGGIEELSTKISYIRTWTYIANHRKWLTNANYWQEKTHLLENNLSDNLHKSLTNRFVDFSASHFMSAEFKGIEPEIEIKSNRSVILNEQIYGFINGFNLKLINLNISHSLFSQTHVKKSLRNMIEEKLNNFLNAPHDSINLGDVSLLKINEVVKIYWGDEEVGLLNKGKNISSPKAESLNSEFLASEKKLLISAKLQDWIDNKIKNDLKPLKEKLDDAISSKVRAIAFNTFDQLGTLKIGEFKSFIKSIDSADKTAISKLGIRIGAKFFYTPNFLKKSALELCAVLWLVYNNSSKNLTLPLPKDGRVSFSTTNKMSSSYWAAIGYIYIKDFALRIDVFEKIFFLARQKIKLGPFLETSDMMNPAGCNSDQLQNILAFCGFDCIDLPNGKKLFHFNGRNKPSNNNNKNKKTIKLNTKNKKNKIINKKDEKKDPNSPFAVLEKLL